MALEKITVVDQIEITEHNFVQVRQATKIIDDGQIISTSYIRHVIAPGDDYLNEDKKVKDICSVVHTPEIIDAYLAQKLINQEA